MAYYSIMFHLQQAVKLDHYIILKNTLTDMGLMSNESKYFLVKQFYA